MNGLEIGVVAQIVSQLPPKLHQKFRSVNRCFRTELKKTTPMGYIDHFNSRYGMILRTPKDQPYTIVAALHNNTWYYRQQIRYQVIPNFPHDIQTTIQLAEKGLTKDVEWKNKRKSMFCATIILCETDAKHMDHMSVIRHQLAKLIQSTDITNDHKSTLISNLYPTSFHVVNNDQRCLESALYHTLRYNNYELVSLLIKKGLDVNEPFDFLCGFQKLKKTPLGFALECCSLPIVKVLLNGGAKVDEPFCFFYNNQPVSLTPLGFALAKRNMDMAGILIKFRASIDMAFDWLVADNSGSITPLGFALVTKQYLMMKCLLERSANASQSFEWVKDGKTIRITPLGFALATGEENHAMMLINHGADVHAPFEWVRNNEVIRVTPLDMANQTYACQVMNIIQARKSVAELLKGAEIGPPSEIAEA